MNGVSTVAASAEGDDKRPATWEVDNRDDVTDSLSSRGGRYGRRSDSNELKLS